MKRRSIREVSVGDILIIGAGFAGIEAARVLRASRKHLNGRRVIVIDAKRTFDFLPVLPDMVGGRIAKEHAMVDLAEYLERLGVNYECGEVVSVDTKAREVCLRGGPRLSYEYLLIAAGSVTNFYGMADMEKRSLKVDTALDAAVLLNTVLTYPQKNIVIVGGGYTGVEIATNIVRLFKKHRLKKYYIHIVEKGEDILMPLAEWMKDYCRLNLCRLRIHLHAACALKEVTDARIKLSSGFEIEDHLLIWAAGVQTPEFVRNLSFERDRQGRLIVDDSLRVSDDVFAAGDAACFEKKGKSLRMAVQFSVCEARVAARNIARLCAGKKKLGRYNPLDLGFLVPMANRCACGEVLGIRVAGVLGWAFHYLMCIYRSLTARERLGIFRDAFKLCRN